MRKIIALLLCLITFPAFAQSTAEQILPGYNTTSGCPGSQLSCWMPWTSSTPMPVGVYGGSGATAGFVLTSNGPGTLATFQAPGGGGGTAFNLLTSGTNTSAAMVVGTGASLTFSGSGTINASSLSGDSIGTSGATIPLNNGGFTQSGSVLFTGTIPTLANGDASVGASATLGGLFTGQGSTNDLTLQNSGASTICSVATGTTTLSCNAVNASAPVTITSTSANALTVGAAGATNPVLQVDDSVASQASGVAIQGKATGVAPTITTSDPAATNSGLTINSKGTGALTIGPLGAGTILFQVSAATKLNVSASAFTYTPAAGAVVHFTYTGPTDTAVTASTEESSVLWNTSAARTWASGSTIALQREHRWETPTYKGAAAQTITEAATAAIDGAPIASTNMTTTTVEDLKIGGGAVVASVGAGINVAPTTGATTNYSILSSGLINSTGGIDVNSHPVWTQKLVTVASAGTFTRNTNDVYLDLECWGGGGAGGGITGTISDSLGGGGGGAGGYSKKTVTAATFGASQTVTLGAAGTGSAGANGGNGGSSSVGSLCVANGGSGGINGSTLLALGGAGGTAGTGDINGPGAPGFTSFGGLSSTVPGGGGNGASTLVGSGGQGPICNSGSASTVGNAGTGNGSGGSGACSNNNAGASLAGGAGTAGYVVITEYISN